MNVLIRFSSIFFAVTLVSLSGFSADPSNGSTVEKKPSVDDMVAIGLSEIDSVVLEAEFQNLIDHIEELEEQFSEQPDQFLKTMTKDPIDYKVLNNTLTSWSTMFSQEARLVDDLQIRFGSVLTGRLHRWSSLGGWLPKLPYYLPIAKTTLGVKVRFNPELSEVVDLPVSLNGVDVQLEAKQSLLSMRGILMVMKGHWPSWTDSYKGHIALSLDTMSLLKVLPEVEQVTESCRQVRAGGDLDGLFTSEVIDLKTVLEKTCSVVDGIQTHTDFQEFLIAVKDDLESIESLVGDAIEDAWDEGVDSSVVSSILNFVSGGFYDYGVKVTTCQETKIPFSKAFLQWTNCEPSVEVKGDVGVGIGDVDGKITVTKDQIRLSADGDVASGLRGEFFLDKIDLAAQAYIFAKTFSLASPRQIELSARLLAKELNDEVEEELSGKNSDLW